MTVKFRRFALVSVLSAALGIGSALTAVGGAPLPAAATTCSGTSVATFSALSAAYTAGSTICLGADISVTGSTLTPGSATSNVINLNGYDLSISAADGKAAINVPPGSSLVLTDTAGTSDVTLLGGSASVAGSYLRGAGAAIGGNGGDDPLGQGSSGQSCGAVTIGGGRITMTGGSAIDPNDGWAAAAAGIGGGGGTDFGASAGDGCDVEITGGRMNIDGGTVPTQSNQSFGSAASIGTAGQIGGSVWADAGTLKVFGAGTATAAGSGYVRLNGAGPGGEAPTAQLAAGASGTSFVMSATDSVASAMPATTNIQFSYSVSFDAGGGSAVSAQTPFWGDPVSSATSYRAGYAFDGWHAGSASGPVFDFSSQLVTSPTTLYAAWLAPSAVGACTGFAAVTFEQVQTYLTAGLTACLNADLTQTQFAASSLNQLDVPSGTTATLDLNGHSITLVGKMVAATASYAAVHVPSGATLTIADSVGTGALNATGGTYTTYTGTAAGIGGNGGNGRATPSAGETAGTIVITGGTVTATGGSAPGANLLATGAGIGGGGSGVDSSLSTKNGGSGGTVSILGGTVTATGGTGARATGAAIGAGGAGANTPTAGTLSIAGTGTALTGGGGYAFNLNKPGAAPTATASGATGISFTRSSTAGTDGGNGNASGGSTSISFSYTISFDSGGGTSIADVTVAGGSSASAPNAPIRANYQFADWRTGSASGPAYGWASVFAPITLYAAWTGVPVTIGYNANGATSGTAPSALSTQFGAGNYSVASAGSLAKNAFQFTSWNSQADGQGASATAGQSLAPTASLTWNAQWVQALTLTATVGSTLAAGAPVGLAYAGMQNGSAWSLTAHSTPVTLGSGTVSGGVVNFSGTLPANLGVGFHTLTFTGTASGGGSLSQYLWFVNGVNGRVIAMTTDPSQMSALQALGDTEYAAWLAAEGGQSGGASAPGATALLANTGARLPLALAISLLAAGIVMGSRRRPVSSPRV